jgi:hypothetical protein
LIKRRKNFLHKALVICHNKKYKLRWGNTRLTTLKENRINELAYLYVNGQAEEHFNEIYTLFTSLYKGKYRTLANDTIKNFDPAEVQAKYEDVLLKSLETFNATLNIPFIPYFRMNLKRRTIDLAKSATRYNNKQEAHTVLTDDEGNETHSIDNLPTSDNVEKTVIERLTKKSDKHKQILVQFLFDHVTDEKTLEIMNLYTDDTQPKLTENLIAKHVGIYNVQVNRKLKKVSKLYNSSLFGDLDAYKIS